MQSVTSSVDTEQPDAAASVLAPAARRAHLGGRYQLAMALALACVAFCLKLPSFMAITLGLARALPREGRRADGQQASRALSACAR